jgi:hypothetical protein
VRLEDCLGGVVDTVVYGTPNSDNFVDDSKATATSLGAKPGSGEALARKTDGVDTNASAVDFELLTSPTMGASNDFVAPTCSNVGFDIVINELVPDPDGTDTANEWLELYNAGSTSADLADWKIAAGSSSFGAQITFVSGTTLAPGAFLVVGGTAVVGANVTGPLSLGNAGGSSDAVRLEDCAGTVVDTVVYGTPNSDGFIDDTKAAATSLAPVPGSGDSLARTADGVDTDACAVDFEVATAPTMGVSNDFVAPACSNVGYDIVINELVPDAEGADDGYEWLELYNAGTASADLADWVIQAGAANYDTQITFVSGTTLAPQAFLVVGGANFADAQVTGPLSLGNASSSADGVRLADCAGTVVDTVVYGLPNSDGLVDDTGAAAVSMAPKPGSGDSLARHSDGLDTNQCGVDFEIAPYVTPGEGNDTPAQDCGAGASRIKVNEFLVNPPGTDSQVGLDWVELYHAGTAPETVTGWMIEVRTGASWGEKATLPVFTMQPGDYYLIGGPNVAGVEVPVASFDLGSGSDGDGIRLTDCKGFPVDTVAYGGVNLDGINDDTHDPALSIAPAVGENESLQRVQDGYDTGDCRMDFAVQTSPTPGAANPDFEPVVCVPSEGTVVINEFIPDPDGSDADLEWIELYNSSGDAMSVAGWYLTTATRVTDYGEPDVLFPGGATVPATGFLVVGGSLVPEADIPANFSIGGGERGDALVLFDCEGTRVDTVVYGPSNEDGMTDDLGNAPGETYGDPPSQYALARRDDGVDDNVGADWFLDGSPTPGITNFQPTFEDTDTVIGPGGCCNGPSDPEGPGGGGRCNTTPHGSSVGLLLGALLWMRRRR